MIQICRKDKEKGYEAIRAEKIDAAEMPFPNLTDDILLSLAVAAKFKCKTSLTDVPFAVTEAELLTELLGDDYKIVIKTYLHTDTSGKYDLVDQL